MARSSSSRDLIFDTDVGSARIRWDGPRATLFLDGVESSALDASDPTYLEFEYMQHMSAVVDSLWGPHERFRALHLGGAACALACAWSASHTRSRHVAVEIDRLLARAVRDHFPIPTSPQVKIRVGDGREIMETVRDGAFDVIARDAFAGGVTPDHLRTIECAIHARRVLSSGGVYLVNCAHGGQANARQDIAALRAVFPFVASIQDPKVGRGGRRGNVVALACEPGVVDADEVDRSLRTLALPARITRPTQLERWVAGTPALTDAAIGYRPARLTSPIEEGDQPG